MNVKRWLNDWSAEVCFLSLFALAVLIFGFVIWQSEKYKNGGFVKDDTVWYSATIVIHYPDKADSINIRTCRVPYVRVGRGWNSLNYTDHIEKHTTEITLDDTDWQEMVNLHNAVHWEHALTEYNWSTKTPDSLKERVNNFLCRDFYQKYNIKKDS